MQRILLFVLLGLLPLRAAADGKVFSRPTAIADAVIPDQRALICWSNGVERLVIETRFAGDGTNFAWVVPLPSQPEIDTATLGLFPTLAFQLRSRIIHDPFEWYAVFLGCLSLGYLLLFVRPGHRIALSDIMACVVVSACLIPLSLVAALMAFPLLMWAIWKVAAREESPIIIAALLFLLVVMSSMLLPALGSAGAVVGVASGVTELATARVGAFETTTITARSSTALMGWLRANQFGVPANTEPVIADYVKRGWVFVASKLARDAAANATNSIHPLSFTFRTEQPVYPLRLTGVDNGPLQVELYVFGPDRAEAERFKVSACASLAFPSQSSGWYRVDSLGTELSAMHPVLRAWAADCRVATKLTASLSPAQMHDDVVIRWSPFQPGREVVYSWRGALITAAGWGTGVMLGGFVLALLALWIRGGWRSVLPRAARWIVALAALTLVAVLAFVPKVSVRSERFRPVSARIALERFADRVLARWTASPPKTIEQARLAVIFEPGMTTNNIYLGGVIREEDSPGNYVIRQTTNGFEVHWYDAYGSEHTRERP